MHVHKMECLLGCVKKKKGELIVIIAGDILRYVLTSRAQCKIRRIQEKIKRKRTYREENGKEKKITRLTREGEER